MIKLEKGIVEITGTGLDLAQELCAIFYAIREEQPEMLAGVITGWSDVLESDIPTLDRRIATGFCKIAVDWIELNEVE